MKNLLSLLLLSLLSVMANGQQDVGYLDNFMRPDGPVEAMIRKGDTMIIGGDFSSLAWERPFGTILDTGTALPDLAYLSPNGQVNDVIADGFGGWIISGNFTQIGGVPRNKIARLNPDGSLHPFNPNPGGTSVSVDALLVNGTGLYVGGNFTSIGGQSRNNIALLDINTGLASTFNPGTNGAVLGFARSGLTLFACGSFTTIGGQNRNRIAAVDLSSNTTLAWNPNPNNTVNQMVLNGANLYIRGSFTSIGVTTRNHLAEINGNSASVLAWNPNVNSIGIANDMKISGSSMIIGGTFTVIGAAPRNNLAAVDLSNGTATSWNPNPNAAVNSLCVNGNTIFASGGFSVIGGVSRKFFAGINATSGAVTNWSPRTDQPALCMAVTGSKLYIGGDFTKVNVTNKSCLAAINMATGAVLSSWSNSFFGGGGVDALALIEDTLFVGGAFSQVDGFLSKGLVRISASCGCSVSLASPSNALNGLVSALEVGNDELYIGGNFSSVGGQPRANLASLNLSDFAVTNWNPSSNGPVRDLLLSKDKLYVAGQFSSIGGQSRIGIAAIDTASGTATAWNANADGAVNAMYATSGKLLVGGNFANIGGQIRNNVAALDTSSATATLWDPNTTVTGNVNAIAVIGRTVYLGGDFIIVGGQVRRGLAAVDGLTGVVSPWSPNVVGSVSGSISNIAMFDNVICTGGFFHSMASNTLRKNFAPLLDSVQDLSPFISIVATNDTICHGDTVTFTASVAFAGDGPTQQWRKNGGDIAGATGISFSSTDLSDGDIIDCVATSSDFGTLSTASNATTMTVNFCPPVITSVAPSVNLCQDGPVDISFTGNFESGNIYTAQLSNTSGSFSSPVNIGSLTNETGGVIHAVIPVNQAVGGGYRIRVVASSPVVPSIDNGVSLTVNARPTPAQVLVSPSGSPAICPANSVTLSVPLHAAFSYSWQRNGSDIPGASANTLVADTLGSYVAIVTNAIGCSRTSIIKNVVAPAFCGQAITSTGNATVCNGQEVAVNFTTTGVSAGNVFTLEISDGFASFASPVAIGTLTGTSGGTISGVIPVGMPAGNTYRLRVNSSLPAMTGKNSPLRLKVVPPLADSIVTLCAVTVDSATGKNRLIWNKPASSDIDSFVFFRKAANSTGYDRIGAQSYARLSTFIDQTSAPRVRSQRYYITAKNLCDESLPVTIHTTMHLTINKGKNNTTWNLIWNGYEGFEHGFYNIWRGQTAASMVLMTSIEARDFNSYTDESAPAGNVFYKISIGDGPVCNPSLRTTADGEWISSNIATNSDGADIGWADMSVYPNPSSTDAQIIIQSSVQDETFQVNIIDIMGRQVLKIDIVANKPYTFGKGLEPGVYTIVATNSAQKKMVQKYLRY